MIPDLLEKAVIHRQLDYEVGRDSAGGPAGDVFKENHKQNIIQSSTFVGEVA